jgi:hypothetical protein
MVWLITDAIPSRVTPVGHKNSGDLFVTGAEGN